MLHRLYVVPLATQQAKANFTLILRRSEMDKSVSGIYQLEARTRLARPVFGDATRAGFPSPAEDILKKNPAALRTEIKEKFSSLYKWLDKQARKWLRKHLPPRKNHSFDWAGLDDSLAPAVAKSAERIKSAEILRRVTLYAIGQDTDSYDYLRKHADKLPKTAKVLTQFLETRVEYTKRKIKTAALDIKERGLIPTRAALIKEAKISRDMLRAPDVQALIESETYYLSKGRAHLLAA